MPERPADPPVATGTRRIVIVGAGVVGLACAAHLRADGHDILVLDRDPAGDKASFGNAGGIAVTEVVPAALPGIAWRIPGWLLDPLGPLSVRPSHLPRMLPWLRHFLASARPREVARIAAALASLNRHALGDLRAMAEPAGLGAMLRPVGALAVYRSAAGFARDRAAWDLRRRHGIICTELDGDAARAMEPALGPCVARAVFTPQWVQVADPRVLVDRLRAHLIDRGCRIRQAEVRAVEPAPAVRLADGERIAADAVVLAAGAWSASLAAGCGDRILLESERGYNATFAAPGIAVTRELIFAEHSFVASPLTAGLRIGGTVEFAGLAAPARPARAGALVTLARRYLPGLAAGDGQVWMGHRPATPDSLPVIGPAPRARGVFYAFGHGHLGLTQAATTGRLIAALVAGRAPHIDIGPFASDRFGSPHGG